MKRTSSMYKIDNDHVCSVGCRPRTHRNVFLRFCIVSSNELVVLDSLENSKEYKNAGKRFRLYGAIGSRELVGRSRGPSN